MTRTPEQALAWTRSRGPIPAAGDPPHRTGWCKRETRTAYDVPSDGSATAAAASRRADLRTDGSKPPTGALLWWTGGSDGAGHVAISENGTVRTVDFPTPGRWGTASSRGELERAWPKIRYAGWSPDIDGVTVLHLPPKPKPKPKPSRLAHIRAELLEVARTAPTKRRRAAAAAAAALLKGFK